MKPREKIGIVGRTGSGKSSLLITLLRIIEYEGDIIIDNINIKKIGLHDLRTKVAVIPQEPVLFSGTIRTNLDQFNKYSENDIWEALEVKFKVIFQRTSAKPFVTELGGLDSVILERGSNLSVGQRQLICIARAVLRVSELLRIEKSNYSNG